MDTLQGQIKSKLRSGFLEAHKFLARFGVYLAPMRYYTAGVNLNELERTKKYWQKKSQMPGLSFDREEQALNLKRICVPFQSEFAEGKFHAEAVQNKYGPGFGLIDAQVLYSFIRSVKPPRVIEIGSGVSTHCMLKALAQNRKEQGTQSSLTCIEPRPSPYLQEAAKTGSIQLLPKIAQSVDIPFFQELEAGDFLFIDSSHVVKPGSDVNYLILEILPRLKPGVFVHFHDINFPYDYPREILRSFLVRNEISLLRAYLIGNTKIKILFCLSYLHYEYPEFLKSVFPLYLPAPDEAGLRLPNKTGSEEAHAPSSIYLQVLC